MPHGGKFNKCVGNLGDPVGDAQMVGDLLKIRYGEISGHKISGR
jgi:hypothetical protein